MPLLFWDASALAKRYTEESGADAEKDRTALLTHSLFAAIRCSDIPTLHKLLTTGVDRFIYNSDGQNPINYAASIDNLDAVRLLIPLYADHPGTCP